MRKALHPSFTWPDSPTISEIMNTMDPDGNPYYPVVTTDPSGGVTITEVIINEGDTNVAGGIFQANADGNLQPQVGFRICGQDWSDRLRLYGGSCSETKGASIHLYGRKYSTADGGDVQNILCYDSSYGNDPEFSIKRKTIGSSTLKTLFTVNRHGDITATRHIDGSTGGIATLVRSGPITDSNFQVDIDGNLAVRDGTSPPRFYFRANSIWYFLAPVSSGEDEDFTVEDQYPTALLLDGSREMAGNLDMYGHTIFNVGNLAMTGDINLGGYEIYNIGGNLDLRGGILLNIGSTPHGHAFSDIGLTLDGGSIGSRLLFNNYGDPGCRQYADLGSGFFTIDTIGSDGETYYSRIGISIGVDPGDCTIAMNAKLDLDDGEIINLTNLELGGFVAVRSSIYFSTDPEERDRIKFDDINDRYLFYINGSVVGYIDGEGVRFHPGAP